MDAETSEELSESEALRTMLKLNSFYDAFFSVMSHALASYFARNYASIIRQGLMRGWHARHPHTERPKTRLKRLYS